MRIFLPVVLMWSALATAADPFDYRPGELSIQSGPLIGQQLKSDRRPILRLSEAERQHLGLPDLGTTVLWVANFIEQPKVMADRKKFHIAAIPLSSISHAQEEIIDRSIFNPFGNGLWQQITSVGPHFHTQTIFYFAQGVRLFSQETDQTTGRLLNPNPVQEIHEVAFTVGAARPERFDPGMALGSAYRRIDMLVGHHEAHRELVMGADIRPYAIEVSPQKLAELLVLATAESTVNRVSRPYNAMTDGCLSTVLRHLDAVMFGGYIPRFPYSWPHGPEAVMAEFAVRGIEYRALPILTSDRTRDITKDDGHYGPERWHPYRHMAGVVGACASLLSQAVTGVGRRLPGVR